MPDISVDNSVINLILEENESFTVASGTTVKVTVQARGAIAALDIPNSGDTDLVGGSNTNLPRKSTVVLDEGATLTSDDFDTIITGFVIS